MRTFRPGEPVIYRKEKFGTSPGPRARSVHPSPKGDDYHYQVDKLWVVVRQEPDGSVVLRTRRGKEHRVPADDPHLRRPGIWERLRYRARFPRLDDATA